MNKQNDKKNPTAQSSPSQGSSPQPDNLSESQPTPSQNPGTPAGGATVPPGGPTVPPPPPEKPPTPPPMNEQDRQALKDFLTQLERHLTDLVSNPRPAVPGRHHESLIQAWSIVQPRFATVITAIDSREHDTGLPAHGLTGPELNFKLGVWRQAREEMLDHGLAKDGAGKDEPWWKRFRSCLGTLLETGNFIMGTLAAVIPHAHAIKEFMEGGKLALDLFERFAHKH